MRRKLFWAIIPLLVMAMPLTASAKDDKSNNISQPTTNEPDTTYYLTNVDVSAKRRVKMSKLDVELKDLPLTVNNISLQPLKLRGIFDFQEATRFAPSVNTRTTYGAFQQVSVRGFDYSPVEIDGVRDERTTFNSYPLPDLTMVESIEVSKGPASVLSGHSSVGGSINIVRKSATNVPQLELLLMNGSWNTYQVSGTIGGKLVDGINTLFNFNRSGGDQWRDLGNRRFSVYNNTNFRLAPKHILDLRLSYNKDFYGTEAGLPATMPGDITEEKTGKVIYKEGDRLRGLNRAQRYNNNSDFMFNESANALLRYTFYMNEDWKLSNKAMYSYDVIDYFSTESLSYPESSDPIYPYFYMRGDKKKYIDLDHVQLTFPLRFQHVAKTFQDHLDITGKFNIGTIKNSILLGGSYTIMDRVSFSGYGVAGEPQSAHNPADDIDVWGPGVNAVISSYNPDNSAPMFERFSKASPSETQVIGVFFQDMMDFSKHLKGFVALRYNNYGIKHFTKSDAIDRKAKYERGEQTANLIYNSLTYRFGLVYQPIEDLSIYTSYSNFFVPDRRARSFSEKQILVDKKGNTIDQSKLDFSKAIFDPTTGYQAEIGTTFNISSKLNGSLSVYHIKQENLVRTIGTIPGVIDGKPIDKSVVAQVGTVLSTGVESEINYSPLENLFFSIGYGLTHARYGEIAKNEYDLKGVDKGDRLNYIPRNTFFSFGNYTFNKGLLSGLDLNYSVTYTDKIYRNFGRNIYYDPYMLLNLGARYTIANSGVSIGLQVNNVLDKHYVAQSLGNQEVPAMPRNFKLMINYKIW